MKFCFRLRLRKKNQFKKYKKSSYIVNLFNHYDNHRQQQQQQQQQIEMPLNESNQLSNNMTYVNDSVVVVGGGDQGTLHRQIPTPIDEKQIAKAQDKVDRLMSIIADTYERTLVRNIRLEELDMRSTDLFRDAEKMKNMAHKMHDKFFWEDKYCLILLIASISAIVLGGLLALVFVPKVTGN
ncbi:unnamed protein product [Rotaria socialis]|uniref:V-SNARE coiled-coil homology domain-containing protein n=2 Tax=Rotaria socialis TaxID=392032 RepID=A0A820ER02_9BILA|nr:unnamed protein product [Rotaria socialis]CAF3298339.1 unnamed protein product [Rotaria socialis]CAF3625639.1 unnamed protein product [Rotaria socialis]CAF3748759.1 unnamed protein product [Rotaria socialis]CAF4249864.1 unnamed protein product [Rotaria socialis]